MDLEAALVPHLCTSEGMDRILLEKVQPDFLYVPDVREMLQISTKYFVDSGMKNAVTLELLQYECPGWFASNQLPEEPYEISYVIDRIRQRYIRNVGRDRLVMAGEKLAEADDASTALRDGATWLTDLLMEVATTRRTELYGDEIGHRIDDYFERSRLMAEGSLTGGIPFGWETISEEIWGLKPGELAVVAGATGRGKSWCTSQVALYASARGTRTYMATLENNKETTMQRLDALVTQIPWTALERGELTLEQRQTLEQASDTIESNVNLLVDAPIRPSEKTVFELFANAKRHDAQLVVIDQLSHITPRDNYRGDKTAQYTEIVTDILALAREYEMVVVLAVQFNREGAGRTKPRLIDISQASWIENSCDFVFGLWATEEMEAQQMMVLSILKARRYWKKSWLLTWKLKKETRLAVSREYTGE